MATHDVGIFEPYRNQDIAAEALDKAQSFAGATIERGDNRSVRQPRDELFDKRQALLDFADAHPDAGIDVAFR